MLSRFMMRPCWSSFSSTSSSLLNNSIRQVVFTVVAILLLTMTVSTTVQAQEDSSTTSTFMNYGCDTTLDACPFESQQNGICDSELGYLQSGCEGGDCWDCDRFCLQFADDCVACLQHGCSYCPGDALCYNSPNYKYDLQKLDNFACAVPDDYFIPPLQLPQRSTTIEDVCRPSDYFFSDPLYSTQKWIFDMINIVPVWKQGYLGTGIRIRINDDGLASDHPDIAGNFDLQGSCNEDDKEAFFYKPQEPLSENSHGTDCAFLAAGRADNGVCGNGMAPQATLSACNGLGQDATFLSTKIEHMDISSNSFGTDACYAEYGEGRRTSRKLLECPFTYVPDDGFTVFPCDVCDFAGSSVSSITELNPGDVSDTCEQAIGDYCYEYYEEDPLACLEFLDFYLSFGQCRFNTLSTIQREALTRGITEGRSGKGILFVWAAGNAYSAGEDTNFEGFLNTRFTISVGAVGKDGKHASYSTPGAALVVVAPGGDSENLTNFFTANVEGGCHDAGVGTSFSTPIVAGVLALVLEANPNLSWRDVQGILASTSRMVTDDPDDDTQVTNAAGITHSSFYGFGIIDAEAAVEAAKTWALYGPEQMVLGKSGVVNLKIADDATKTLTSTIRIAPPGATLISEDFVGDTFENTTSRSEGGSTTRQDQTEQVFFITESVVVYVDLSHFSRGDLAIVLTSPHGTKSVLSPGKRPETSQVESDNEEESWKLMTVRSWGEMPRGDWTLDITDLLAGDVDMCVDSDWSIVDQGNKLECNFFQYQGYCVDGSVDEVELDLSNAAYLLTILDADGLTFADACCACGGGQTRTSNDNVFVDQLVEWRLIIYGRLVDENGSPVYTSGDGGAGSPAESRGGGGLVSKPTLLWILAVASLIYALQ